MYYESSCKNRCFNELKIYLLTIILHSQYLRNVFPKNAVLFGLTINSLFSYTSHKPIFHFCHYNLSLSQLFITFTTNK